MALEPPPTRRAMNLDLLTDYTIPYQHPLAVHFPVVLLLLGAVAALGYLALGRPAWRLAALLFCALGAGTAYWAEETGETLEETVEGEPMAEAVLHTHEESAEWTVRVALLAVLSLGGASLVARRRGLGAPEPWWLRLAAVPAGAAAVLVAYTAHLGGIMVWGVPAG